MKKMVCDWGMFVVDVEDLMKYIKSSIKDESVTVTLEEGGYCISISSEETNRALESFYSLQYDLEALYGVSANERAVHVDGSNDLFSIDLKLNLCVFLLGSEGIYGSLLDRIDTYKIKSSLSKKAISEGVGKALVDILKDTDLSCNLEDIMSSLNCYKPLKVKDCSNKFLCPVGIECGSEDVVNMLLEELDSVYYNSGGDDMKIQLGCHVGYFGKVEKGVTEIMTYILVEIV